MRNHATWLANQKKAREATSRVAEETYSTVPHTFVFHRGQIGKNVGQLVLDMRRVMEPFTGRSLKRLARLPKGPMLYFRVAKYTLIKDVVSSLRRHRMHEQQFSHHPLLVLNNFGIEGMHIKLMATMFQNMFPSINVHKLNLNSVKRCVLINYDPVSQEVEFRHYSLKVVPVGMSRGVKKLMQEKFPNMNKLEDISELLMKLVPHEMEITHIFDAYDEIGVNLSESEAEQDGDHNITELPQLVKILEGMGEGKVLYHSFSKYSFVKRSLEGIKRKRQEGQESDDEVEDPGKQEDQAPAEESEDEAEYYRQAVGEEPDEDMFPGAKRKRAPGKSPMPFKKKKLSQGKGPPHDKRSFKSSDRGDKDGRKRFGDRKPLEGRNRFRKSEGGKKFGQKGGRFAGQKKRDAGKKFGGQKTFKGRAGMKQQKSSGGKRDFKHKKGKS
ncbi:hypothetical protein H4Q32_009815 [Labeo rohita]|uniref:Brix domain-containing protein n=1 Tax=Labeo rohita TaxID=84645 RepID=A0ABQ8MT86_LABRO|nr:hypothetical protein H4Q32_009815 [Labeo rohita]